MAEKLLCYRPSISSEAEKSAPFAVMEALISKVKGSTPTRPGDSMLLMSDGQWRGSVGGGNLEWKLMRTGQLLQIRIQEQGALPNPKTMNIEHGLGCATDQCCGGRVFAHLVPIPRAFSTMMTERHSRIYQFLNDGRLSLAGAFSTDQQWQANVVDFPQKDSQEKLQKSLQNANKTQVDDGNNFIYKAKYQAPLWIFGAGHIARQLAPLACNLGFKVTIFDGRERWAQASAFPTEAKIKMQAMPDRGRQPSPDTTVLVMTHSHKLDYDLLHLLQAWQLDYLGVIGSHTKSIRFRDRLDKDGLDDSKVMMPIGLPDMGKKPLEVAISVLAELLQRRNKQ